MFIFDEIENTLHPSLAKKLVSTIQSSVKKLKDKFSEDIFIVFIITHSPFVVSSVLSNLDQKIYLIDDGKFKNIIMDPRSKRLVFKDTLEEESLGFSGPESVFIASSMLGFEASDVGYPENFILTEENSLCELLNVLKDKEIIKNIGFISARGNGNVEKRAEVFQKICSDEVILKCNPFYAEKYGVIVDEFESKEVSNGGLNKIKEKIGNERFIELNRQSLEDYYELFNESLFNEYKSESSGKKSDELGKIKGNYAKKIAEKVNSTEDFKRLFKDEEELWELLLK